MKIYSDIFNKTEQMLDDGKISKNDEMKKLPFVMVRLLTVGSDQVINSFQEVYNSINLVFDSESEDVVVDEKCRNRGIGEVLNKDAINIARKMAKIPIEHNIEIIEYPKKSTINNYFWVVFIAFGSSC